MLMTACILLDDETNNQRFHTPMTRPERSQPIVSPCQNVCKIENNICIGCHRTLEQISNWTKMSDEERKKIMQS